MREGTYVIGVSIVSGLLFYVGQDQLPISTLFTWALFFGGSGAVAILMLSLNRLRSELRLNQLELARRNAELRLAREVQDALFPDSFPESSDLEFAAAYIPSHEIGGDYYDVQELPDGTFLIAIADVSGKGISAAILMANLQAQLRVLGQVFTDLKALAAELNSQLCRMTGPARYATLFLAKWQKRDNFLVYVNAGHHPPILLRSGGIERLGEGGPPIGLFLKSQYQTGGINLQSEDLLVLYSDGIVEAVSSHDEEFGEGRLVSTIQAHRARPLKEIKLQVMETVKNWAVEAADDMTLLLIRWKQAGEADK